MIYCIYLQEELQAWLAFQKRKWDIQARQRRTRKRRRRDGGTGGDGALGLIRSGPATGLAGFMHRRARNILEQPWQIVQVRGVLRIFVC